LKLLTISPLPKTAEEVKSGA
jgi:hypothetical protein